MKRSIASSLCRFRIEDEEKITDTLVKREIAQAFNEQRCFPFYPDREIITLIQEGNPVEMFRERFIDALRKTFSQIADGNQTIENRLSQDVRLSARLISAMGFLYRAMAEENYTTLPDRRIVIIKERPGSPTLFHISNESTVIAHVGQGPPWTEISTLYLGLNTFSTMITERKKGGSAIFEAFKKLLLVEERAIELGFAHSAVQSPEISRSLMFLVDQVIANVQQDEIEEKELPEAPPVKKFTDASRRTILKDLDARLDRDILNFDYDQNMKAIRALERYARRYKKAGDTESLHEIVRLLVAASGHDIHEIRNRANLLLERVLAPKEFDAPLATRFINLNAGDSYTFTFRLDANQEYILRVYHNRSKNELAIDGDISVDEVKLRYKKDKDVFIGQYTFRDYGHYDFAVVRKKIKNTEWVNEHGCNGRVNVIPDVRGEILLEIFTDIHGHTKVYWRDGDNHPGLLYNEYGEVIRLGNLADITAHLEDIKERYCITSLYLLGTQKRGNNREDWAPEASSPSPFSPMSLVDIEPSLGGEQELKKLVARAHEFDIRVIVDIIPHVNRSSDHLPDEQIVKTYDGNGNLVYRSSTDGRYGSWNDGKLPNYRLFAVWEWLSHSIGTLIDEFDIDGIRFDSAHAVPIMMKKNNFPFIYEQKRDHEEMVEGTIIVNDRENDHFITTGYYDSACRDQIAVPLHYYLMLNIERKLKEKKKDYFLHIAECFWGHERFLTRTGLIPYNSSLFKICENIIHGKSDVREIYHLFDHYFPAVLPEGTELLGILGNHDERRALNTFGHRGLRASVALTSFMSNIIMDYEGSAEGESWKVYLDNIYVNWNQFEYAANRSVDPFYREWYQFHRNAKGRGYLIWANNNMVAAAMKFTAETIWLGAFNFAEANQGISLQFDNPKLPIPDEEFYRLSDVIFSDTTHSYSYFKGSELKISRINTTVSYTDRVKLFKLDTIKKDSFYNELLKDSFSRLCTLADVDSIEKNFSFQEIIKHSRTYKDVTHFIMKHLVPLFWEEDQETLLLGMKRSVYHLFKKEILAGEVLRGYSRSMMEEDNEVLKSLGTRLTLYNQPGPLVFMSAEADPFSKSGGLANVVYELPREMARLGEEVHVITGLYRFGSPKAEEKMQKAIQKYDITWSGKNIRFFIMGDQYEVGVHHGMVDGIHYYLLDHFEFFDGLYWGFTSDEKLRRRIAFARACAEVMTVFEIKPHFTFTNDAYTGLFNGIVRSDQYYAHSETFKNNTFLHVIHNGGWQYFDSYHRHENGFDLFNLFNLPSWRAGDFCDPLHGDRLNCMATGIRFADRTITVSPSYARQIEYACDGLEHLLENVFGVSNAIGNDFREKILKRFDESCFVDNNYASLLEHIQNNDSLRHKIKQRYPEILDGPFAPDAIKDEKRRAIVTRMRNKLLLQKERHLDVDPDAILFSMIHRISEQKGFQLLLEASEGILRTLGIQVIAGGAIASGDRRGEEIAHGLSRLAEYYPGRVNVNIGFQDVAVPLLSSDLFGMPSMHEPGGISQLEAFAAGSLVVARATGGLRDTVFPVQFEGDTVSGNGFLFSDYHSWAFYDAMQRAASFFKTNDEDTIYNARVNAEESIYFWDRPARQYVTELYRMTETIRILD